MLKGINYGSSRFDPQEWVSQKKSRKLDKLADCTTESNQIVWTLLGSESIPGSNYSTPQLKFGDSTLKGKKHE
jgi:hypothetical protein